MQTSNSAKMTMNIVIVTPGHPGPDRKSLPPSLTAPYLAALATPLVDHIKIYDLAVEPFDLDAPIPDIALVMRLCSCMAIEPPSTLACSPVVGSVIITFGLFFCGMPSSAE